MHEFRAGEIVKIRDRGIEKEVIVFRHLGEVVYVFDRANRPYLFDVKDVIPSGNSILSTALEPFQYKMQNPSNRIN